MSLYRIFDAAFPPAQAPPGCHGVLGYLGGDRALNVWSLSDWERYPTLRAFSAWVPDFTRDDPVATAMQACEAAEALGWAPHQPDARAIVCDLETLTEPAWYAAYAGAVDARGFTAVAYGSLSTVLANAASDVWAAAWDADPVLLPGQTIHAHQYATAGAVDYSVADDWLFARGGEGPRHT